MLLLAGVLAGACNDPSGPSGGALLVSTSMTGAEADTDGWELVVDGEPVLTLHGNDRKELALDGGTHTLDLEGLDAPCTVEPAVPFEVRVSGGDRIPVDLQVNCPPTGAIVTPRFTGIDIPTFYRVAVDGVPGNSVMTSAPMALTRLGPGEHTFELLDAPANCTPDGPSSKTVTVIAGAFVPLDFAVRCVAITGVIKILVTTEGEDAPLDYRAEIDGSARPFTLDAPFHLSGVAGGEHAVKLSVPLNCVVEDDARSVTVEVGGPVRDTVEVEFLVTCVRLRATLRVVTTTSGTIPDVEAYDVYLWEGYYYYPIFLGRVPTSGVLEVEVVPGMHSLTMGLPLGCGITPEPGQFTIAHEQVLELRYEVRCEP
jgi:hypothetical protein